MTRRRAVVLAIIWSVTMLTVTGWVAGQTDDDVSFGDAVLVGLVAATVVVAAIGRKK
jgi:hypothetical protein